MKKVSLLNIEIDNLSQVELLKELKRGVVITPNVDHLVKLQKDRIFYEIYKKSDYVVLDSRILFKFLQYLKTPVKEVITGSDFLPAFYNYHKNNHKVKIFLLGAKPGIAEKAMIKINEKIDREIVVGCYSPPRGFENDEEEMKKINKLINASGASVVCVGLGAPKQEKWIFSAKKQLKNVCIYLAVGAAIDFEAGNVKRAPNFMKKLSLEWLYRLFREPKRLWRRYLIEDVEIIKLIYLQKTNKYKNPFAKGNNSNN